MKVKVSSKVPNHREYYIKVSGDTEDPDDIFASEFKFCLHVGPSWEDETRLDVELEGNRSYGGGTPAEFAAALRALADEVEKITG